MSEEKKYQLKKGVLCCNSKHGIIEDQEIYPESQWPEGEADLLVKEGYLIRIKEQKLKTVT